MVSSDSFFGEADDIFVAFSGLEFDFSVSSDFVSGGGTASFDLEVDGSVFGRSVLVGEFILSPV